MNLPQLPQDKANHAVYGTVIFSAVNAVFGKDIALGVTAAFAVLKEVYDKVSKKGVPDVMDVVATLAIPVGLYVTYA